MFEAKSSNVGNALGILKYLMATCHMAFPFIILNSSSLPILLVDFLVSGYISSL